MEQLVIMFFGVWFLLLTVYQFQRPLLKRLKHYDLFNLIPGLKLFASNPIKHDYHLYVREKTTSGFTKYQKIDSFLKKRLYYFLFNPDHRIRNPFINIAAGFTTNEATGLSADKHSTTFRYLFLLSLCHSYGNGNNQPKQFTLIVTVGTDPNFEPQLLITSAVHDLT
jgi:hypothetical protein